jgi:D-sedoheptulose 7-phosphate isomerase
MHSKSEMGMGMKSIVRKQLAQSIATLEAVLADDSIADTLVRLGELTAATMKTGGKLLVAGNGGSAADAQHLVAEFVGRLTISRPALRAIALTVDTSIMTPGDIFLGISTSGNSKNIIKAVDLANKMGLTTVGFSGNDGGAMAALCHLNIVIPSSTTMNIQESHLVLEHIYCMLVELCYFGPDFGRQPHVLSE